MPLYGTAQAGSNATPGLNLTSVCPGDFFTLFSGLETPANGLKSVAFTRGESLSQNDAGTSFFMSGMAADMTIDIEAANADLDGSYYAVAAGITPDANGNAAYTDTGRASFWRAKITTYTAGTMPVVTARR